MKQPFFRKSVRGMFQEVAGILVLHWILSLIQLIMCSLTCDEVLSPDHRMIFSPVYSISSSWVMNKRGVCSQENKEDALETFRAWMTLRHDIPEYHYNSAYSASQMSDWVDYLETYVKSAGIEDHQCVIRHAVWIFVRYINTVKVRSEYALKIPCDGWRQWTHHRNACLWIALKFEDLRYEDIDVFLTRADSREDLVSAEVDVLTELGFGVGPPKDFMPLMAVILGLPDRVVHEAQEILTRFAARPNLWVGKSNALVCAATIVATLEVTGGDRCDSFSHVYKLRDLGVGSVPDLYDMADVVLNSIYDAL